MNTIERKRQFLKEVLSGKKSIHDFNTKTLEQKNLSFETVSTVNLEWIIYLYEKYSSQIENATLSTSVLTPDELKKYREIEKQFIYK